MELLLKDLKELFDSEFARVEKEMRDCMSNGATEIYMTWLSYKNGMHKSYEMFEKLLKRI